MPLFANLFVLLSTIYTRIVPDKVIRTKWKSDIHKIWYRLHVQDNLEKDCIAVSYARVLSTCKQSPCLNSSKYETTYLNDFDSNFSFCHTLSLESILLAFQIRWWETLFRLNSLQICVHLHQSNIVFVNKVLKVRCFLGIVP